MLFKEEEISVVFDVWFVAGVWAEKKELLHDIQDCKIQDLLANCEE
jgi:hypothetical protein